MDIQNDKLNDYDFKEENLAFKTSEARKELKRLGSPTEIQEHNLRKVLDWLYRWGYSSAELISKMLGRANLSHARRLEKQRWIRSVTVKGYQTYFVLTDNGLAEAIKNYSVLQDIQGHSASRFTTELLSNPVRVNLPNLYHDLIVQSETIAALQKGFIIDYLTPRMYDFKGAYALNNLPNAIFVYETLNEQKKIVNKMLGIEIELIPKSRERFDLFITEMLDDVQTQRLNRYKIISPSQAILNRYAQALKPGNKVKMWKSHGKGKFEYIGKTHTVQSWVPTYIKLRKTGSTAPYF